MASALEQLFVTITLLDKVSGSSKGVGESLRLMQQDGENAFRTMGNSVLGFTSAAGGLNTLAEPARNFTRAIREIASLDAMPKKLAGLKEAGKIFATQFGGDALKVIRSASKIKSALPEIGRKAAAALPGKALAALPGKALAALPAAALQASAAGGTRRKQTASGSGRTGKSPGISMGETFAAGAAISTAMSAAIPLPAISAKFQETFSGLQAAIPLPAISAKFQETFSGVQAAIAQGVLPVTDLWNRALSSTLGAVTGMVRDIPGLQTVLDGVGMATSAAQMAMEGFSWAMEMQKNVSAFTSQLQLLWAGCLKSSAATGSMTLAQQISAVSTALWGQTIGSSAIWLNLASVAQWVLNTAMYGCPLVWIIGAFLALVGVVALVVVYWDDLCEFVVKYADYLLMLLGPIGWVVAAFRNWDKIVDFLSGIWDWFEKTFPAIANLVEKVVTILWRRFQQGLEFWKEIFVNAWEFVKGIFSGIGDWFAGLWKGVVDAGSVFYDWLSGKLVPLVQFFGSIFEWVAGLPATIWSGIKSVFSGIDGFIGKVLGMLSKIPGLGWLDPAVSANGVQAGPVVSDVTEARRHDVEAGGVRSSSNTTNNNFGGVSIYAPGGISPAQLEEWAVLQV